jgi:hypothetical protein
VKLIIDKPIFPKNFSGFLETGKVEKGKKHRDLSGKSRYLPPS